MGSHSGGTVGDRLGIGSRRRSLDARRFAAVLVAGLTVCGVDGSRLALAQGPARLARPALRIRYAPRGLPMRRVGAAVRGPGALPVVALAPKDHLAETATASPTLYWEVGGALVAPIERVTLTLTDAATGRVSTFPIQPPAVVPSRVGPRPIRLDSLGISLRPGGEYLWRVDVELVNGLAGQDAAYIRRRAGTASPRGDALQRAQRASSMALWYDAFAALADSAARDSSASIGAIRDRYRADTVRPVR